MKALDDKLSQTDAGEGEDGFLGLSLLDCSLGASWENCPLYIKAILSKGGGGSHSTMADRKHRDLGVQLMIIKITGTIFGTPGGFRDPC
jgi:hypothetical protein